MSKACGGPSYDCRFLRTVSRFRHLRTKLSCLNFDVKSITIISSSQALEKRFLIYESRGYSPFAFPHGRTCQFSCLVYHLFFIEISFLIKDTTRVRSMNNVQCQVKREQSAMTANQCEVVRLALGILVSANCPPVNSLATTPPAETL